MDGYKTLKAGQAVEFDIEHGAKGRHAVNIRSMDSQADGEAGSSSDEGADVSTESSQHNEVAESR